MSRMSSIASLAALLLLAAAPLAAQGSEDVKQLEKSMWEAWSKKDLATFEKRLSDDHWNVTAGGIVAGKAANLARMKEAPCEVRSFELGDMSVQKLGTEAALVAYEADQDATCGGEKLPAHIYVTALWKKAGGNWVNASYHETAAQE